MRTLVTLMFLTLAAPVTAQVTAMNWQGQFVFNPNDPIPGGTMGALMAEFFGPQAMTGTVPVSGRFGVNLAIPLTVQNYRFAATQDAVTEMSITLGGLTLSADTARIAQQGSLSHVGSTAFSGGPFCTMFSICDHLGLPRTSWGNQAYLVLESSHVELDEDEGRLEQQFGATFGAMIGLTPQFGDFQPAVATRFGNVAVNGMNIQFQSFPGRPVFRVLRMPHLRTLEGTQDIEVAEVYLEFEFEGRQETVNIRGTITAAQIDP